MSKYKVQETKRNQTLLIVEGNHEKNELFWLVFKCFPEVNIDLNNVLIYGTNIYMLYEDIVKMYGDDWVEEEIDVDLPFVISKKKTPDNVRYKSDFTKILLVFDYERHDTNFSERKITQMQRKFSDVTDMGQLYINYPMMESFRYCNTFDDDQYLSATIPIAMLGKFKSLASQMKLSGIAVTEYKKEDFIKLMQMNIKRLKNLSEDCPNILSYQTYQSISVAQEIAAKQYDIVQDKQELWVLNTCLFLILDYFGNKNGFYDSIIS